MKKFFAKTYVWLLLVVLYAPILFIAVTSFTESRVLGNWKGFSLQLYRNLLTGDMQGIADALARATDAYGAAFRKLATGPGNLVRRMERFREENFIHPSKTAAPSFLDPPEPGDNPP